MMRSEASFHTTVGAGKVAPARPKAICQISSRIAAQMIGGTKLLTSACPKRLNWREPAPGRATFSGRIFTGDGVASSDFDVTAESDMVGVL